MRSFISRVASFHEPKIHSSAGTDTVPSAETSEDADVRMRGAEETIPQGFCKDGVSLRFLRWVYEHSRLQEPMMQSEAMDSLSHEQLQAIAKEMRIFSEYPFEEEDRRRKESTREELCAALKQPPRTIAQVIFHFVKPYTATGGWSYADMLKAGECSEEIGVPVDDLIGPANLFLSYAWRYDFVEVLETIFEYTKNLSTEEQQGLRVWVDIFVLNQHDVMAKSNAWLADTFRNAIKEIGSTISIVAPWHAPIPFSRAWCVWELYCTIIGGCELHILLPDKQKGIFLRTLLSDFDRIVEVLTGIHSGESDAWSNPNAPISDKDLIHNAIRAFGGFNLVDEVICDGMRKWLIKTAMDYVEALDEYGEEELDLMYHVGKLLSSQGRYDEALNIFQDCEKRVIILLGVEHPRYLNTLNDMALVYNKQGDYPKALGLYEKVLDGSKKVLGVEHPDYLGTLNNMALVYDNQGDYPKALGLYEKVLDGRRKVLGVEHPDYLATLNSIASLRQRK